MSDTTNGSLDPIMAEVRRNREALSARFDNDVQKMMACHDEQARKRGRKLVSLPPRPPIRIVKTPPAA